MWNNPNLQLSRRRMLQLLGATAASAALAACAPATAPGTTTDTGAAAPAGEQTVLRWYANADPTRNNWMTDIAIPKFRELHPEITIEPIIVPWGEFDPKLTSMFAAGDLPEVWGNWGSTGYVEYVKRGMAIYQQDHIDAAADELELEDFPASALEGVSIEGKLVGLPLYILGTYTYYNKDIFDEAGLDYPPSNWDDESWTWDRMLEVAATLTRNYDDPATGQYGVVSGLGSPEEMPWLWGHEIWPDDALRTGVAQEIYFDDPAVVEAFQAQADLVCRHSVAPDQSVSEALSAVGSPFQAGKVAMNISGGWGFWSLKNVEGAFRWGAAALPRVKPGILKNALYADPMLISRQTPLQDQAWQFVKYINSVEGLRDFTVATWSPPSRQSLLGYWTNLWPEQDLQAELIESLQGSWRYGVVTPWNRIAGYSQIYDPIMAELEPVMLCQTTMAEVAPVIDRRVEEILAGLEFVE
jgi:multiple sugar transport system substrate-binding protein